MKYHDYAVSLRIPIEELYYQAHINDDGETVMDEDTPPKIKAVKIEHTLYDPWHYQREKTTDAYLGELIKRRDNDTEHSKELPKLFATKDELDNADPYSEERLKIEKEIMAKWCSPRESIEEMLKGLVVTWEPMSTGKRKTERLKNLDRFKETRHQTVIDGKATFYVVKSEPIMGTVYEPGKIILPEDKKAFGSVTEQMTYYDELSQVHYRGDFNVPTDDNGDITLSGVCLYEHFQKFKPGKLSVKI